MPKKPTGRPEEPLILTGPWKDAVRSAMSRKPDSTTPKRAKPAATKKRNANK